DIGTAYLRIALLPETARGPLQDKFREYLDSRLQTYRAGTDVARVNQLLHQTAQLQSQIWELALDAIEHASSPPVAAQIVPSLNDMFDIVTTRTAATQMHSPAIVWVMLGGLTLGRSFLGLRPGRQCAAKLAARRDVRVSLFADPLRDHRHGVSACGPHPRHRHGSRVAGCA